MRGAESQKRIRSGRRSPRLPLACQVNELPAEHRHVWAELAARCSMSDLWTSQYFMQHLQSLLAAGPSKAIRASLHYLHCSICFRFWGIAVTSVRSGHCSRSRRPHSWRHHCRPPASSRPARRARPAPRCWSAYSASSRRLRECGKPPGKPLSLFVSGACRLWSTRPGQRMPKAGSGSAPHWRC